MRAKLQAAYQAAVSSASAVYCHGDLSLSNIRVCKGELGLIDTQWIVALRGHDAAHFAHKIEYEALTIKSWTSALVAALLQGYGEPELTSSASWQFYQLRYLLQRATRPTNRFTKTNWGIKRARKELRRQLLP
jgi:hypothetical protein